MDLKALSSFLTGLLFGNSYAQLSTPIEIVKRITIVMILILIIFGILCYLAYLFLEKIKEISSYPEMLKSKEDKKNSDDKCFEYSNKKQKLITNYYKKD